MDIDFCIINNTWGFYFVFGVIIEIVLGFGCKGLMFPTKSMGIHFVFSVLVLVSCCKSS